ncbi:MAG: response regulator transcription factor [Candidatus Muiribacteriota bacterium]|jgi:DNA-binding NarL/FixJ family response regulator
MINVLLADDHAVVRAGIKSVIERKDIKVIAEASDGEEVLKISSNLKPDIYILDVSMPNLNGIETSHRILKENPQAKVIILSMHDDKTFVEKAFKYGVKGYILKESAVEEIITAIKEVYSGNFYLSPRISHYIISGFLWNNMNEEQREETTLTQREKEVLQMIAEGLTSKEIADKLCLSVNTVQVHRKNIMKKCSAHKQTDLVKVALKEGLIKI